MEYGTSIPQAPQQRKRNQPTRTKTIRKSPDLHESSIGNTEYVAARIPMAKGGAPSLSA